MGPAGTPGHNLFVFSEDPDGNWIAVDHMIADTFATGRHSPARPDHPMIAA
jgi:hypothetical protein